MKIFNLKSLIAFSLCIFSSFSFSEEKIYEGKGKSIGFNEDEIAVVVTIKATKNNGKIIIKDITAQHEETPKLGGPAITKLISTAKETQNCTNLDNIGGATVSSAACKRALKLAIKDIEKQK